MAFDPLADYSRFLKLMFVAEASGCWHWISITDKDGYGLFKAGSLINGTRKNFRAHRWIYERLRGAIREGLEPDHLCQNKGCVNPYHIELVTHQENIKRAIFKDVCRKGHKKVAGKPCKTCALNHRNKLLVKDPEYFKRWYQQNKKRR